MFTIPQALALLQWGLSFTLTLPQATGTFSACDAQHLLSLPYDDVDAAPVGQIQILPFATFGSAPSSGATSYLCPLNGDSGSASATGRLGRWEADGVFRNAEIWLTTAPGGGKSWTFTLQKGTTDGTLVDTAVIVTISGTSTYGSYTAADLTIARGDLVVWKCVPSGTPAAANQMHLSLEFESDGPKVSSYGGFCGGGFAFSNTLDNPAFSIANWVTSTSTASVAAADGNITGYGLTVHNAAISGGGSITFTVVKNGVAQDGSGGTVNTTLTLNAGTQVAQTDFTLPIVGGDRVYVRGVANVSNMSASSVALGVQFAATINGQSQVCGHSANTLDTGASGDFFAFTTGRGGNSSNWVGSEVPQPAPITSFSLTKNYVALTAAPGAGKQWDFFAHVNLARPAGGQHVILSNSETADNDISGTVAIVQGDTFSYEHDPTNSPASGVFPVWSFIMATAASNVNEEETFVGVNPPQGDPVGDLYFARIRTGVETRFASEALIRDPGDHFEGKKPATLLTIGSNERVLSLTGGWTASTFTLRVSDVPDPITGDRLWRGLTKTRTIEQSEVEVYRCHAPHGVIIGNPFRMMAGVIKPGGFKASSGFVFDFSCVDILGDRFANPLNQPNMPTYRLNTTDIVNLVSESDGKYVPRVLGYAFESGVGVVPMIPIVEDVNLNALLGGAAVSVQVDVWLLCEGAVYDILGGYYNILIWGKDQVVLAGDLTHATPNSTAAGIGFVWQAQNDGTMGSTEPTWPGSGTVADNGITWEIAGAYDPRARFPIPATDYSDFLTHPFAPNWTAVTGLATQYVDYPFASGVRRMIPVFTSHDHRYGLALREKRTTVLFDVVGTTVQPSSGLPITRFTQTIMRLLIDYLFAPSNLTTYGAIPVYHALDGPYSIFDTASADDAEAVGDALGGLLVGQVLAADGQQQGLWQWIGDMLRGGSLRIGPNRHGQMHFARKDVTAQPTIRFRAHRAIIDSNYQTDGSRRATTIEWRAGKRYADPFGSIVTPSTGDPLPVSKNDWGWAIGLQKLTNKDAFDALWNTHAALLPALKFDNVVTGDLNTALQVAHRELDDATGPGPSYHGTMLFELTGPLEELFLRLDDNGKTRELGDVIWILDDEGPTDDGETLERGWITKIRVDPEADTCTLSGEILPEV